MSTCASSRPALNLKSQGPFLLTLGATQRTDRMFVLYSRCQTKSLVPITKFTLPLEYITYFTKCDMGHHPSKMSDQSHSLIWYGRVLLNESTQWCGVETDGHLTLAGNTRTYPIDTVCLHPGFSQLILGRMELDSRGNTSFISYPYQCKVTNQLYEEQTVALWFITKGCPRCGSQRYMSFSNPFTILNQKERNWHITWLVE